MRHKARAGPQRQARERACPACGHYVCVPFFDGGEQPLATLAWPDSVAAAAALARHRLDFVRCVECGHVYNAAFDYSAVPYSEMPNLMFNRGGLWSEFVRAAGGQILARLPERPTVVEIGHGDGSFLAMLAGARPRGRYVGFDPHGAGQGEGAVELRREMFDPAVHIGELRPHLAISRHVLEHLTNPLGFLQRISFAASNLGLALLTYFEVPCIDRALDSRRTTDFYFEHNSHFTTKSFTHMLGRCATAVEAVGHGYDGEVIYGFARLGGRIHHRAYAGAAHAFWDAAVRARAVIRVQLADLHASGRRVAIWGGTGKSAAFMVRHGVDAERFPTVVDSDPAKVGTHVPGTGQEIRFRDWLLDHPVDVVLIPPQWRARDVLEEMARHDIGCEAVLIEHGGRLIDFVRDDHPYQRPEPETAAPQQTISPGPRRTYRSRSGTA